MYLDYWQHFLHTILGFQTNRISKMLSPCSSCKLSSQVNTGKLYTIKVIWSYKLPNTSMIFIQSSGDKKLFVLFNKHQNTLNRIPYKKLLLFHPYFWIHFSCVKDFLQNQRQKNSTMKESLSKLIISYILTFFRIGSQKDRSYQFFFPVTSTNIGISPQKLSAFYLTTFSHTAVKFQGHNQCQS